MSTYSTNLALELIANGDQSGTWGDTTNTNLGTLIEQAISGYVTQACTGGTDTITIPNGTTGVARNMFLELTGTGNGTLVVPANKKLYFIYNNTSTAITVKVSGQTGVSVPAAAKMVLVSNGTDVVVATNYLSSLTLGSALPIASGGTGATSASAARTALSAAASGANSDITSLSGLTTPLSVAQGGTGSTTASGARTALSVPSTSGTGASGTWGISVTGTATNVTGTVAVANGGTGNATATAYAVQCGGTTTTGAHQSVASVGTAGQVLTSNGAAALPSFQTITSFVAGMIILWSGSAASIPSGWVICDGTNSTPNLRDRFVVGAGTTYAVGATGGSTDAVVVSHTHTATVTDPTHSHTFVVNDMSGSSGRQAPGVNTGTDAGTKTTASVATGITVSNSTTGVSATNANLPPYYALCYIMKT